MILEVAILNVRAGMTDAFEAAFREASPIIASMPGYHFHELRRCFEVSSRYVLLVHWQRLEDHTVGFRQSAEYQRWRTLLHHFYDPFPTVEHYSEPLVIKGKSGGGERAVKHARRQND
jgi:heme-degrading monooxygenase HmoA